jgi:type II secretory pathway predicted ATPase ExeA/outer membrane protein OmpA-like peptidoglycan-associated protein
MFESYYKLDANPFRLSADEQFRFAHKNYLKAWSYLKYALEQGEGFIMVTGRPGSGKTTLIRDILAQVDESQILAVNLVTNQLQAEELLRKVALEFGLKAESYNKATLLTRIQEFITKEYQAGKRAVIVIDEAQNLTLNGLEELRLLSNLQTGSHPLFQIFLVGQDELRSLILSTEMEQIRQRMIASCQIDAMDLPQTQGYIEHRLGIVGWNQDPVFDDVIFPLIHYLSGGIPRKINHIVSRLLLYGALEEKHEFTEEDVWIVARELFDEERLSIESGDSFTTFKEKYEQREDSLEEGTVAQADPGEAVGITKSDVDLNQESHDEVGLITGSNSGEEVADEGVSVSEEEVADEGVSVSDEEVADEGVSESEEDVGVAYKQGKNGLETESIAKFSPYREGLTDADSRFLAEKLSIDESAEPPTAKPSDETVRLTRPDVGTAAEVAVLGKTFLNELELETLTSKVVGEDRISIEDAQTDTRESNPEEILNLPSMQAERRKHEIDEKGGFINTAETFEVEDLLAGTLGRSLRNIFVIVVVGIFILLLFVVKPERIEQFWDATVAKLQSVLMPAEEGFQVVPPTTDIQVQDPTEEHPSLVDGAPARDSQTNIPTEVPARIDDSLTAERQIQIPTDEEIAQFDESETIEPPAITQQGQERVDSAMAAANDTDEGGPEVLMEDEGRDVMMPYGEITGLESELDLVERASKDYIASQSKYQKVEIGATDVEATQTTPAIKKFQIYFEFDNPNIPEQFKEMLNDLYIVLSLDKAATMTITGYTDASGNPVYNMNLSLKRANAVASYFTERGINPDRIQVEGRGPVPKSTLAEHEELERRFGNRRVEIVLREAGE